MPVSHTGLEPLFGSAISGQAIQRAEDIAFKSLELTGSGHPASRAVVCQLVQLASAYYTQRLDGPAAAPAQIVEASEGEFSQNPEVARLQRDALFHIRGEKEFVRTKSGETALAPTFIEVARHALSSGSAAGEARQPKDERGDASVELPAQHMPIQTRAVLQSFGLHVLRVAYMHQAGLRADADALDRRALRLQSSCALWTFSDGLWSLSRGLFNERADYDRVLSQLRSGRKGINDYAAPSTNALREWFDYFLRISSDQVSFMTETLGSDAMRRRIEKVIAIKAGREKSIRTEAVLPMHHVYAAGPLRREEFAQLSGLRPRAAHELISALLRTGLLVSEGQSRRLRFGLPLDCVEILMPGFWPEASKEL